MRLEALRDQLVALHDELPRNGLVTWTGGNVSARDPETGLVAIKPSGVRYGALTAESTTLVVSRRMTAPDLDRAIELAASGRVDLGWLVTDRFALADAPRAFEALAARRGLKVVVLPSEDA